MSMQELLYWLIKSFRFLVFISCFGTLTWQLSKCCKRFLEKPQGKTVAENWDHKVPSVGTILAYLGTTAWIIFFFKNKTFFVFQDRKLKLFEKEISTHLAYSGNFYFHFFYRLSHWVKILWGFTRFFFKQMGESFSFLSWKTKTFYF